MNASQKIFLNVADVVNSDTLLSVIQIQPDIFS